jgi:hypothetical protein
MPEVLLNQITLKRAIGASRLLRLLRAGWLKPVERNGHGILFAPRDVHKALRMLERRFCPPDKVEIQRVRLSELRHGRQRVRKERKLKPTIDSIELDWTEVDEELVRNARGQCI